MKDLEKDMAIIQAAIDGANIQFRAYGSSEWDSEGSEQQCFNFVDYEYRIAPDVVYKIVNREIITYVIEQPEPSVYGKVTKGYWVEGDPA